MKVFSMKLTVTPKSGDVELHTAPMLAVANMASTAKEELGRYPTTLSPRATPFSLRAAAMAATLCLSWPNVMKPGACPSPYVMSATLLSSGCFKRFSAKLSSQPRNHSGMSWIVFVISTTCGHGHTYMYTCTCTCNQHVNYSSVSMYMYMYTVHVQCQLL